jgi:ribosomal protein S12 methylthiotransferase accessory factor
MHLSLNVNQMSGATWRSIKSEDTFKLVTANIKLFGITRISNITYLDITGIPVYTCMRPRGLSVTVSAGKGLSHIDAIVSAAMESIEMDVAERVSQSEAIYASFDQLPDSSRIPFELLPVISTSNFKSKTKVGWVEAYTLDKSLLFYVPYECISMDARLVTGGLATFCWGSNGLASSVERTEAILSGLYEVIERDTIFCWNYYQEINSSSKFFRLDISTIPFNSSLELIRKIESSGLRLYLIQLRNEINIPVFACHILNGLDQANTTATGYGCHYDAEIALNRAITEAVQSRTGFIAGSREDILKAKFRSTSYDDINNFFSNFILENLFIEQNQPSSTLSALNLIIERFSSLGWLPPIVYDYPNAEPFSVVRVICPNLLPVCFSGMSINHPRYHSFNPPRTSFQRFIESLY